jgi:UDP-glucuronate 4-epimerase
MGRTILLTGAAGFIGFHTAKALLDKGDNVIGIDNLNDYYDPQLKRDRLAILKEYPSFKFYKQNIEDPIKIEEKIDTICHLAAQAGVRHSMENPFLCERSNSLGTLNIFEFARHNNIKNVVFASSSSIYGKEKDLPFKESARLDTPISLYAATKIAAELYAHVYNHLFGINMVGLRFFAVYGPWGRPDMAQLKFVKNIREGKPIDVYNNGNNKRDFTYIDDIVSGVTTAIDRVETLKFEMINLSGRRPVDLHKFIGEIEKNIGKKAIRNNMPMQAGDVAETSADISKAQKLLGYQPQTSIEDGVKNLVDWYISYFN